MSFSKSYSIHLLSADGCDRIDGVTSFVGEDDSGSFAVRPGHARFITALVFGLARFRVDGEPWRYLALPGGLLYFDHNILSVATRRYVVDSDYERIADVLSEQLLKEEEDLRAMKRSLERMEEEVMRRLWQVRRQE